MKKKRTKSFYFMAIVVFGLVYLLICEIVLRVFWDKPNPLSQITQKSVEYLIEPNRVQHNKSSIDGEFEYDAHINKYGYRGKDFAMPKDSKTLRVLAMGDSFTFGVGVEDDQTIPALLDQKLKEKYPNIEVINAGVGYASPISHYMNLENFHLKYDPDVILLFFDLTDLVDDWRHERFAIYDQSGKLLRFDDMYLNGKRDWFKTATYYSSFAKYLYSKVRPFWVNLYYVGFKTYMKAIRNGTKIKADIINMEGVLSDQAMLDYDALLMMRDQPWKKDLIRKEWKRTSAYLKKINAMTKSRGIPLILISYPHGIYVDKNQWKDGRKIWGFEDKKYTDYFAFELLEKFAKKENIPFINTLESFLEAPSKKYFYDWDGHMTLEGYKLVVQGVLKNSQLYTIFDQAQEKINDG